MTDIRRTLLWVVFTMSLFLLWERWNEFNGQPTIFGGTPRPAATAGAAPAGSGATGASGVPAATGAAVPSSTAAAPSAVPSAAAAPASEKVTITTDVVRATLDTRGGTLVGLSLLKYADHVHPDQSVRLMAQDAERVYLAQTGLITTEPGVTLPTHLSPMKLLPGERTLAAGQDRLSVVFESTAANGVVLRKTYTFTRGAYTIDVKHEVINDGSATVSPELYLQLTRDGNKPAGESSFYFTFTGPAMYTEAKHYKKIDFKDIEKGKADHDTAADNGWIAMVQHYFTSAWLLPPPTKREFRTAKVGENLYSIAMVVPLGTLAPGASAASLYSSCGPA